MARKVVAPLFRLRRCLTAPDAIDRHLERVLRGASDERDNLFREFSEALERDGEGQASTPPIDLQVYIPISPSAKQNGRRVSSRDAWQILRSIYIRSQAATRGAAAPHTGEMNEASAAETAAALAACAVDPAAEGVHQDSGAQTRAPRKRAPPPEANAPPPEVPGAESPLPAPEPDAPPPEETKQTAPPPPPAADEEVRSLPNPAPATPRPRLISNGFFGTERSRAGA